MLPREQKRGGGIDYDCPKCDNDVTDTFAATYDKGRHRWLAPKFNVGVEFRFQAKVLADRLSSSHRLWHRKVAHLIYEHFLTVRRPGKATVVGEVRRLRK
jgi:hypothetical protein